MTEHELSELNKKVVNEIKKTLVDVHNSKLRLEVLRNENYVRGAAKKMFGEWIARLDFIRRQIAVKFPQSYELLKENILSEEDTIQIDYIISCLVSSEKPVRDMVEDFFIKGIEQQKQPLVNAD